VDFFIEDNMSKDKLQTTDFRVNLKCPQLLYYPHISMIPLGEGDNYCLDIVYYIKECLYFK